MSEVSTSTSASTSAVVRYAAVEGGGTTWVAAISENDPDNIIERESFTTTSPKETLTKVRDWLFARLPIYNFVSIGVASFGPIDAKPSSPRHGFITSTPKPGWRDTDVLGLLGMRAGGPLSHLPSLFDTDVNAPAMAEYVLHKKPGMTSSVYITIGTGVGVGVVCNGATIHGLVHPEGGHMMVKVKPGDEAFAGTCPFHGSCIEGLVSTGAISKRANIPASELPNLSDEDTIWDTIAFYIAQMCANLILTVSPERISIGGGVMNRAILYNKIRAHTLSILNGYIVHDVLTTGQIDNLIGPSHWGDKAGIVGALYLSRCALNK